MNESDLYNQRMEMISALSFIRGYTRSGLHATENPREKQIFGIIMEKCNQGLAFLDGDKNAKSKT